MIIPIFLLFLLSLSLFLSPSLFSLSFSDLSLKTHRPTNPYHPQPLEKSLITTLISSSPAIILASLTGNEGYSDESSCTVSKRQEERCFKSKHAETHPQAETSHAELPNKLDPQSPNRTSLNRKRSFLFCLS